jgi:hypothetical protein
MKNKKNEVDEMFDLEMQTRRIEALAGLKKALEQEIIPAVKVGIETMKTGGVLDDMKDHVTFTIHGVKKEIIKMIETWKELPSRQENYKFATVTLNKGEEVEIILFTKAYEN